MNKIPWTVPLLCFALATAGTARGQEQSPAFLAEPFQPFLREHCGECHRGAEAAGGLDLDRLAAGSIDAESLQRWVRIHDRLANGEMPPADAEAPNTSDKRQFLASLAAALNQADRARRQTVLRRLNRVEYENTLNDLFGIRADVRDMLPEDPSAHGFDTVGDVLAISAEQMEVYLRAADKALDEVFGPDRAPKRVDQRKPLGQDEFASRSIGRLFVKTDDDSLITFQGHWCPTVFHSGQATVDGTYRVRIHAKTYQTDQPLVMAVYGGDVIVGRGPSHLVGYYDIAPGDDWTVIEFEDYLDARGSYQMKPYNLHAPTQGPKRFAGPGLMIGEVEVVGPLEPWPPLSRQALLGDVDPDTGTLVDARAIFQRLLPRAFRRATAPAEVEPYLALTSAALDDGRSFLDALRVGLQGILCSPEFLFLEEPTDSGRIGPFALASRLSYFLWSSMPDDELLSLARRDRLNDPQELGAQVERMLRGPKAERFVANFTGQWLDLRDMDFTEPDKLRYPEYDEMLRHAMLEETRRFFRAVLEGDLPVTDFVDSDWTILNERLAVHYGIEGVRGQAFRRVTLPPDSVRGGVLTQASVLKVTANGTNTSPVVRGAWVLENILGQSVPPPPPGVSAIEPDIRGATTIREQLRKHRDTDSCAACHRHLDPPGFALESFDPIGGRRDWYRSLGEGERVDREINRRRVQYRRGPPVDPRGQWTDGRTFADIREFKRQVLADPERIAGCLAEKLLTYGSGRGLGFSDRAAVRAIVAETQDHDYGLRSLIQAVVRSETFQSK